MPKIKSLKPSLESVAPPLARRAVSEPDRSSLRDTAQPWRAWYKTGRWQRLRMAILKRDRFTCQVTGVALVGRYPAPNSPVVDHCVPHRGDEALFWEESNLQAVSKAYHDSDKQRLERSCQI